MPHARGKNEQMSEKIYQLAIVIVMWNIFFFLIFIDSESRINGRQQNAITSQCAIHRMNHAAEFTAFWINLNSSTERRAFMTNMLSKSGFHHVRVPAFAPGAEYKRHLKNLRKPCKRNTDIDIAVIMSHLRAIHTAIYHDPRSSPYALVLEDDVRFLFSLDLRVLLASAPSDFAILQLTTSNVEALNLLWERHMQQDEWYRVHWRNCTRNGKTYLFWSAQAYLIHKPLLKPFIDSVITMDAQKRPIGYTIQNSFYPEECKRPCVLAQCLFADSYIYAGGSPTFVSTVPLVTGARIGMNSTIHPLEVKSHRSGFAKIRALAQQMRAQLQQQRQAGDSRVGLGVVPSYIQYQEPIPC
jgi:GR25 family glycosyltransferase involved in LPS biosynthesis